MHLAGHDETAQLVERTSDMDKVNANRSGHFTITVAERYFRTVFSAALLSAILLGAAKSPALIFTFSLLGIYLMETVLMGRDPVYALTKRMRLGDHLQVWLKTLATGALLPVVMVGDLVSSLTVFFLSSLGGLFVTAAIIGRDAIEALATLLRRPPNSEPLGA